MVTSLQNICYLSWKSWWNCLREIMIEENNLDIMAYPEESDFLRDREIYTDYAFDILNVYFESEQNRIIISGKNHQNLRDYLIDIMKCYAKNKKYSLSTLYLGILFLDIYMDSYLLSEVQEHQKLVALVTLLVAAKTDEIDEKIPSIKELLDLVDLSEELGVDLRKKSNYDSKLISAAYKSYLQLYCTLEFMILQTLRFNTIRPTPMTFLSIFQRIAVTECDLDDTQKCSELNIESIADLKFYVAYYLKILSDILMYDMSFNYFLPSKVASAMIATSRRLLNINTVWTLQLEFITRTSLEEISPIMNAFLDKMCSVDECTTGDDIKEENSLNVDSGFHSNEISFAELSPSSEKSKNGDDYFDEVLDQEKKKFKAEL